MVEKILINKEETDKITNDFGFLSYLGMTDK